MQHIKTYPSGLRLVVEEMKNFESVSFNIFVQTGSVNETPEIAGISHLIEHMLFTGTKNRSAFDIVSTLDRIGAEVNAYTDKFETVYYTRSTKDNVEICVDVLSDMFFNSVFNLKELKKEKNVVCEEIKMYADDPDSTSQKLSDANFYAGTVVANDVIGTKKTVKSVTRQKILNYMSKYYIPQNVILSFAGNISLKEAEMLVEKYFNNHYKDEKNLPNIYLAMKKLAMPEKAIAVSQYKNNEQSQVSILFRSVSPTDKLYRASKIFSLIWGAGMSSRLFQTIREKYGLVYKIYSQNTNHRFGGDMAIVFGTSTKNVPFALETIRDEINKIVLEGITEQELLFSKTQIISLVKLKQEKTSLVSLSNAKRLSSTNKLISKEEIIEEINNVTVEDVNKVIKYIYDNNNYSIGMVGKNTKIDLLKHFSK